jgi:hypothetical protein
LKTGSEVEAGLQEGEDVDYLLQLLQRVRLTTLDKKKVITR